jgi:hypothetical protein
LNSPGIKNFIFVVMVFTKFQLFEPFNLTDIVNKTPHRVIFIGNKITRHIP